MSNVIFENTDFIIHQSLECALPGYLILSLKKPCTSLTKLSEEMSQQLVYLLQLTQKAIEHVIQPERVYTCSFCELQTQLHYHLFPRTQEIAEIYANAHHLAKDAPVDGPRLFPWIKDHYQPAEETEILEKTCRKIADFITNSPKV